MQLREKIFGIFKDYTEPAGGGQASAAEGGHYDVTIAGADGRIILGEEIEIFPAKPLDAFASFETRAFEARDIREGKPLLAMTAGRSRCPRTSAVASYQAIKSPHLLKLFGAGIVEWPSEAKQVYAFVFDRPPAKRLMSVDGRKILRIGEERIVPALIQPAISVLEELYAADLVHGAITADNIFMAGGEGTEVAILGECLSSAPFFRHAAVFETVERGMAQPSGRGSGTSKNDLYALGVCVAFALRGENPLGGKSAEEVVQEKIEHGSYGALVGGTRLPGYLNEFLRGVLHDDEAARWDMEDTQRWLEGRRLSAKQPHNVMRARRPFVFREKKFWDLRTLAMSLAAHIPDTLALIEKDSLDLWLKRNFEDRDLEARLETFWKKESGALRERVVAELAQVLDPYAPVRYKNLSIFPSGFGTALADAMARAEDVQDYADLISLQLFNGWVNQRYEEIPDASGIVTLFEKCRNFLAQKMPGYGIERLVYLLNREIVCLSPMFKDYYVLGPGHFLLALERLAQRGQRLEPLLDRHMIAFISVREPKMIDPYLGHIISHDRGYQIIGTLRTLAAIQRRFRIQPVPALARALLGQMGPAVERFYDRDLRKEVTQNLASAGTGGNLTALLEIVDSAAVVQDDQMRFAQARREFVLLMRERAALEQQLSRQGTYGLASGRQVAMLVSSALGAASVLLTVLYHYLWS
jgi:eukaryotic-like serine/threonine-protein kinase